LPLSGCSAASKSPPTSAAAVTPESSDNEDNQKGSRDNTPQVLTPSADGEVSYKSDVSVIDASNASEGYIMVKYKGSNTKVKLQITGPDQITYTYDLHGGYEVFPLTAGDGSYTVAVFENISDNQYATAQSETISVELSNEFGPYLYPSQYVNFTADSLPVEKASELAAAADNDLDVVASVYNYIIDNFSYDYDKAANVKSGYLPDVDEVFSTNTGICFDYTAVIATMLRTQGIPTRLEVGYMGEQYHSWVSIYTDETGWINGIIEFDGDEWKMLDPTFASTSKEPESFTTENSKYTTKYVY
jgi:transglutaminase-like putative cysteine protease